MKRTTIIAILVVFALAATPLWTVNATADDVMEPISVDGGANGLGVLAQNNNEIHGEMAEYVLLIIGEDGEIIIFSKGFSSLIRTIPDSEMPLDDVAVIVGFYNWPIQDVYTITGEDGNDPLADVAVIVGFHGEAGEIIIFSKGFSSIIRTIPGHENVPLADVAVIVGFHRDAGGIIVFDESKGFSSLIRSEPIGDFHVDGVGPEPVPYTVLTVEQEAALAELGIIL